MNLKRLRDEFSALRMLIPKPIPLVPAGMPHQPPYFRPTQGPYAGPGSGGSSIRSRIRPRLGPVEGAPGPENAAL